MSRYGQRTRVSTAISTWGQPVPKGVLKTAEYLMIAGGGGGGNGVSGVYNGGGGGGTSSIPAGNGAAGGKGVVIIRHPDTFNAATTLTVGTLTTTAGYHIYTFNDSGTIGWS